MDDYDVCHYCYRLAVVTLYLRRGLLRRLLDLPSRQRRVCRKHVHRNDRPGGWYA